MTRQEPLQFILTVILAFGLFRCSGPQNEGTSRNGAHVDIVGILKIWRGEDLSNAAKEIITLEPLEGPGGDHRLFTLRFLDNFPNLTLGTGALIRVKGAQSGSSEIMVQEISNLEEPQRLHGGGSFSPSGEQKTAVLLISFSDSALSCGASEINEVMFGAEGSVNELYQVSSHQRVTFLGATYGPYALPVQGHSSCDLFLWRDLAREAAKANGVNLEQFDHFVYVIPDSACPWAGLASRGGPKSEAFILGNNNCKNLPVISHEIGHNLGLDHANAIRADEILRYGDPTDPMGNPGFNDQNLCQLNAPHRDQLGWIDSEKIKMVTESGPFRLAPLEEDSQNIGGTEPVYQILKIPTDEGYLYVSDRQPIGPFDRSCLGLQVRGVSIHRWDGKAGSPTYLLHTLGPSESYQVGRFSISVLSRSESDVLVSVSDGCRESPRIDLALWSHGISSAQYTVFIRNADGASCPNALFRMKLELPTGVTASLDQTEMLLAPGESRTQNLLLTKDSLAPQGDLGFVFRVTDDDNRPIHGIAVNSIFPDVVVDYQNMVNLSYDSYVAPWPFLGTSLVQGELTWSTAVPSTTYCEWTPMNTADIPGGKYENPYLSDGNMCFFNSPYSPTFGAALRAGTTYQFRLESKDGWGNVVLERTLTFTTPPALLVLGKASRFDGNRIGVDYHGNETLGIISILNTGFDPVTLGTVRVTGLFSEQFQFDVDTKGHVLKIGESYNLHLPIRKVIRAVSVEVMPDTKGVSEITITSSFYKPVSINY